MAQTLVRVRMHFAINFFGNTYDTLECFETFTLNKAFLKNLGSNVILNNKMKTNQPFEALTWKHLQFVILIIFL